MPHATAGALGVANPARPATTTTSPAASAAAGLIRSRIRFAARGTGVACSAASSAHSASDSPAVDATGAAAAAAAAAGSAPPTTATAAAAASRAAAAAAGSYTTASAVGSRHSPPAAAHSHAAAAARSEPAAESPARSGGGGWVRAPLRKPSVKARVDPAGHDPGRSGPARPGRSNKPDGPFPGNHTNRNYRPGWSFGRAGPVARRPGAGARIDSRIGRSAGPQRIRSGSGYRAGHKARGHPDDLPGRARAGPQENRDYQGEPCTPAGEAADSWGILPHLTSVIKRLLPGPPLPPPFCGSTRCTSAARPPRRAAHPPFCRRLLPPPSGQTAVGSGRTGVGPGGGLGAPLRAALREPTVSRRTPSAHAHAGRTICRHGGGTHSTCPARGRRAPR